MIAIDDLVHLLDLHYLIGMTNVYAVLVNYGTSRWGWASPSGGKILNVCSCFLVQPPVPLINTFWAGFKVPVIAVFFKWINLSLLLFAGVSLGVGIAFGWKNP